ncbi:MAG: hypothetical protein ACE5HZ_01345 [Fidelibacterota bacterium]
MRRPTWASVALVLSVPISSTLWGIGTSFLTVPSTPRELGLGGSSVILTGDPSLSRGNPALIVQDLPSIQIYLGYHQWLTGIRGSSVLVARPALGGTVGFRIRQLAMSDLELRTEIPADEFLSHFGASGTAAEVIWGKRLRLRPSGTPGSEGKGIRFGATLRWIRTELYIYSSSGVGADLGAVWPVIQDRLALGAAVRNVGAMGPLNKESPTLPTAISVAAAYRPPIPDASPPPGLSSVMTLEVEVSRRHGVVTRVAGETGLGVMRLTLGSRFSQRVTAVGASLAVTWRRFQVSYGVEVGSHSLGIPHLFQVSTILP